MGPNETVLRDFYDRYGNGDRNCLWAILDNGVTWRSTGFGNWSGVNGVRECLNTMASEWDLTRHDFLDMSGTDDRSFVVRVAIGATHRESSAKVSLEKTDTVRMQDGMIVDFEESFDRSILEQAILRR